MKNFKQYDEFINEYGIADHAPTTQRGIPFLVYKGEISPEDTEKLRIINEKVESMRNHHRRSGHTERFTELLERIIRGERIPREQFYVATGGQQFGIKFINSLVDSASMKIEKERNKMFVVSGLSEDFTKNYIFQMRGKLLGKKIGLMD